MVTKMDSLLIFKSELLLGFHTCERCGKRDENSNRVTLRKGCRNEERVLCLSCTVKAKQNVEKINTSIKKSFVESNNIIDFPVSYNSESNTIEIGEKVQKPSNNNKISKLVISLIIFPILSILILSGVILFFSYKPSSFEITKATTETTTTTYTSHKSYDYNYYKTTMTYTSKSPYSSFRNMYGTPTTLCAHNGCTNYIAPSGDTNCCSTHSSKCIDCGCYIDEDAHWCVSCLKNAANQYQ